MGTHACASVGLICLRFLELASLIAWLLLVGALFLSVQCLVLLLAVVVFIIIFIKPEARCYRNVQIIIIIIIIITIIKLVLYGFFCGFVYTVLQPSSGIFSQQHHHRHHQQPHQRQQQGNSHRSLNCQGWASSLTSRFSLIPFGA